MATTPVNKPVMTVQRAVGLMTHRHSVSVTFCANPIDVLYCTGGNGGATCESFEVSSQQQQTRICILSL